MRFILFDFKKQSLQVFPFGVVNAYGVVHSMGQLAHYAHLLVGIGGSGKTDSLKVVVAHRLTATEGQQQSTVNTSATTPLWDAPSPKFSVTLRLHSSMAFLLMSTVST